MGFFKSLLKKTAPPSSSHESAFPELYNGMRVEILDPANILIFVGRLQVLGVDLLEVRGEKGGYLPRALYNQPVKVRGFQKDGESFTLNGSVGANGPDFWRIEKLKCPQSSEGRSFFRQNTELEGQVEGITASRGQKYPCKVRDVSAGGARVVTEKLFELNATFHLEAILLPGEAPFNITCQVKRIMVRPSPGRPAKKFEYGCEFVDLPQREQERLVQSIFTLQRKTLQSSRNW